MFDLSRPAGRSSFGKAGLMSLGLPAAFQSFGVLVFFSPTIPYFSNIWLDEGMFDVMSRMAPAFKLS